MKITTMVIDRPPRKESDLIFLPMPSRTVDVGETPAGCDRLVAALPPVFDPFSGSLVFSFLWAEKQFVDPTAKG